MKPEQEKAIWEAIAAMLNEEGKYISPLAHMRATELDALPKCPKCGKELNFLSDEYPNGFCDNEDCSEFVEIEDDL